MISWRASPMSRGCYTVRGHRHAASRAVPCARPRADALRGAEQRTRWPEGVRSSTSRGCLHAQVHRTGYLAFNLFSRRGHDHGAKRDFAVVAPALAELMTQVGQR
jgi:hypothetical protein